MISDLGLGLFGASWLAALGLGLRGEHAYRSLPELTPTEGSGPLPGLSIIVPARNEERNLPRLLDALNAQIYPGRQEVIVVDDQSTDGSARQAELRGARVVALERLPEGWLGKPHACQRGAEAAQGEWLLFVDADTAFTPRAAASAVAYALQHELDGCSLFLAQRTRGPLEALAIASAFACLFAAQGRPRGMLNGQFILLRRAAFESVRGFEAVRHEVLEDVALGQRLLEAGCRVPLLRGEALGSVQMYQSLEQMWHGLTRLGAGALAQAKWRALLMVFMAAQLAGVALLLALAGALPPVRPLLLLGWSTSALILLSWAGRAGRLAAALAAPLGGALIVLAGTTGLLRRLVGWGWNWRGRTV